MGKTGDTGEKGDIGDTGLTVSTVFRNETKPKSMRSETVNTVKNWADMADWGRDKTFW